jgi:hypothetical protein
VYKLTGKGIEGFVDASSAGKTDQRKSYSGYIFKLGNAAVSWGSKKQRCTSLSSTEAEYMNLAEICKEAIFLKGLYKEVRGIDETVAIFNDNQAAQEIVRNPVHHSRSKHTDVRHNFVRELVQEGKIKLEYLNTKEIIADMLKLCPRMN